MERRILPADKISPVAASAVAAFHSAVIDDVSKTVASDHVVVVGMAQNPFVKRARAALDKAGIRFTYLEYGSYVSQWKQRLAIKLWAGFPTFPMVFVDGTLMGGFKELTALIAEGKLKG
jgi:glutaredoxin-related protein